MRRTALPLGLVLSTALACAGGDDVQTLDCAAEPGRNCTAGEVDRSASGASFDPSDPVPGDGSVSVTVRVRLISEDTGGPIEGAGVRLELPTCPDAVVTQPAAFTDADGRTEGSVRSATPGTCPVRVAARGAMFVRTFDVGQIEFAETDLVLSTDTTEITLDGSLPNRRVRPNGTDVARLEVVARNAPGRPLVGRQLSLSFEPAGPEAMPIAPTNAFGRAQATITSLVVGRFAVRASLDGIPLTIDAPLIFSDDQAVRLLVVEQPTTATVGVALDPPFRLEAHGPSGQRDLFYDARANAYAGAVPLGGMSVEAFDDGVATFSSLTFQSAGRVTVQFSAGSLDPVDAAPVDVGD